MAFDEKRFKEWLGELAPTATAYRAFSFYLKAIEKEYHTDLDGMSPHEADLVEDSLTQAVRAARTSDTPLRSKYQRRVENIQAAYRAYRRYQEALRTLPEPAADSALAQRSNIILGSLQGKMYLAPDAFPPEEYPLPQPQTV